MYSYRLNATVVPESYKCMCSTNGVNVKNSLNFRRMLLKIKSYSITMKHDPTLTYSYYKILSLLHVDYLYFHIKTLSLCVLFYSPISSASISVEVTRY